MTYRGNSVDGAGVRFIPIAARLAAGTTDAHRRFTLLTYAQGDGVAAGEHVVCVSKWIPAPNDTQTDDVMKRHISLLPERYGIPEQSPLRARVTLTGLNNFRFDLIDQD